MYYSNISGANKLRKGEIAIIAERVGYSVSHVTNVIAGRRNDITGQIEKEIKRLTKGRRK